MVDLMRALGPVWQLMHGLYLQAPNSLAGLESHCPLALHSRHLVCCGEDAAEAFEFAVGAPCPSAFGMGYSSAFDGVERVEDLDEEYVTGDAGPAARAGWALGVWLRRAAGY